MTAKRTQPRAGKETQPAEPARKASAAKPRQGTPRRQAADEQAPMAFAEALKSIMDGEKQSKARFEALAASGNPRGLVAALAIATQQADRAAARMAAELARVLAEHGDWAEGRQS